MRVQMERMEPMVLLARQDRREILDQPEPRDRQDRKAILETRVLPARQVLLAPMAHPVLTEPNQSNWLFINGRQVSQQAHLEVQHTHGQPIHLVLRQVDGH